MRRLDLNKHECELVDATMFRQHGWVLGARLSDHTEDAMSSVELDADLEYVVLIRMRSMLFLESRLFARKRRF